MCIIDRVICSCLHRLLVRSLFIIIDFIIMRSFHQRRLKKERLFITFASQKPPSASALLGGEHRSCSLADESILTVCESAKGRKMRSLSFLKLIIVKSIIYIFGLAFLS